MTIYHNHMKVKIEHTVKNSSTLSFNNKPNQPAPPSWKYHAGKTNSATRGPDLRFSPVDSSALLSGRGLQEDKWKISILTFKQLSYSGRNKTYLDHVTKDHNPQQNNILCRGGWFLSPWKKQTAKLPTWNPTRTLGKVATRAYSVRIRF